MEPCNLLLGQKYDTSFERMADLDWKDNRTPVSKEFDDIYYAHEDGLAESKYIFVAGCGLQEVSHSKDQIRVGELGFGTGLNFIATCLEAKAWLPTLNRLDFYSVEKFPLTADQILKALDFWPECALWKDQISEFSQSLQAGWNQMTLQETPFHLNLFYGDVDDFLKENFGEMDAWYLDGHSPRKNPQMWSPEVFRSLSDKTLSGGRFSTFASAGFVKRGLMEVGFQVQKRPGFGRKRDSLVGTKI
jgi:tRNA 5-methylaminomethyl-2-thiouridine biosynthesis bifunctional protein